VRACELCYKHLEDRGELKPKAGVGGDEYKQGGAGAGHVKPELSHEKKISRHEDYLASVLTPAFLAGKIEKSSVNVTPLRRTVLIGESVKEKRDCLNGLQSRASMHMQSIVQYLLRLNKHNISNIDAWEKMIVSLIKNVVTSVDPDVRAGDKLDIRPFVKIKSIPGGAISESAYIEGVVFRKNVAHKKMVYNKENPKLLILSGGIEFHRMDYRLSSLDTLIDQEDKFLEIMVDKIMSLSPDIILVGKSVSRRAQELLSSHHVVVFQHVKVRRVLGQC
jgi:chaperonin GroEL (HSP60 family)